MSSRPTWDQTWLNISLVVAERSKCVRRKVGCVIVTPDQRVAATGYNGPPSGYEADGPCSVWCERAGQPLGKGGGYGDCVSVHAEVNALLYSSRIEVSGGTCYVTCPPCWDCAKIIANSGVSTCVFMTRDEDASLDPQRSIDLMEASGLLVYHTPLEVLFKVEA